MEATSAHKPSIPDNILQPLLSIAASSTFEEAIKALTETSKTNKGRSNLATKSIIPTVLQLVQCLSRSSTNQLLLLSLRLLRNLCAGEALNQDMFIESNGVEIVYSVINDYVGLIHGDSEQVFVRAGLQVLANASLAGEKQQCAIWDQFFPDGFVKVARIRKRETCDPLCMVIYVCCDGNRKMFDKLCKDPGLAIMKEIIRTASTVGFGEDWFKLLLSRIYLENSHFPTLFSMISPENYRDSKPQYAKFSSEQAFLLQILSGILNERINAIRVNIDFPHSVLAIFERAATASDFSLRGPSPLPKSQSTVDVLGYSLCILRDICAQDGSNECSEGIVNRLVSKGLLDLLLSLLRELELPSTIRKALKPGENQGPTPGSAKVCPYKGFRRDLVSVIGNCAYRSKNVQDEIRRKNGILILLQQCVLDEDNPFLREWGIWCVRNVLEGNVENQQVVAELDVQGTVETPELTGAGVRVEVDPETRRAKLVNIS